MLKPEEFESKTVFRKFEWNGGSEKGGYDEYWIPLTAVDAQVPDDEAFMQRRIGITFNRYGKDEAIVTLWVRSIAGQHGISFPRVDTMKKVIELAKMARLPCAKGEVETKQLPDTVTVNGLKLHIQSLCERNPQGKRDTIYFRSDKGWEALWDIDKREWLTCKASYPLPSRHKAELIRKLEL